MITPLLGVLGVVTTEGSQWRHEIRSSWLQPSLVPTSIVTRLVMRGLDASASLLAEAARERDVVFVEALGTLSKNRGPLTSTLLWLRCAVVAWPHAELIGKAEDDTWIHLGDVERLLRAALRGLASTTCTGARATRPTTGTPPRTAPSASVAVGLCTSTERSPPWH